MINYSYHAAPYIPRIYVFDSWASTSDPSPILPAPSIPWLWHGPSVLCIYELAFFSVLCHTIRIMWYLSFCLLSFSILPSKSISFVKNGKISLFMAKSVVYTHRIFLIHLSSEDTQVIPYLGVTIVNNTAVNRSKNVFFEVSFSFSSVKYS